jgi:hypothetical protein
MRPVSSSIRKPAPAHCYAVWQLPYAADSGAGEGLRPTIRIEMTYAPLRQAPVTLPVSSFMAEAHGRLPEVAQIPCVSVTETAAEKLVALTRRISFHRDGRVPDPSGRCFAYVKTMDDKPRARLVDTLRHE